MKKLNKREGIKFLGLFGLPIVQLIDTRDVINGNLDISVGVSIRTSPKYATSRNVWLPSIHNCTNLSDITNFIEDHEIIYDVIIHKTVVPISIGSVSKVESFHKSFLMLETYRNFEDRKSGNIHNRLTIPYIGERSLVRFIELERHDPIEYMDFIRVFRYLRKLPFETYNLEYVVEDEKILFTDFTVGW